MKYSFFSKAQFMQLAQVHDVHCVSIYLPTSRAGKEVDEGQSRLLLKNCLKQVARILEQANLRLPDIESYLKPVELLLEDATFWRYQSDGLAIFLSEEGLHHFSLPIHFQTYTYVSDHFYLKPLIPFFTGDGGFYLLRLSQHQVDFYEASRHQITDIRIEDLVPEAIGETLTEEESAAGFRGMHGTNSAPVYHGHGSQNKDQIRIEKYFRAVDNGLMKMIHDTRRPMILACQDQYYPVYKKVTRYPYLFDEYIGGNPEEEDVVWLHEKAWHILEPYFLRHRDAKIREFQDLQHTEKTSGDIEKIIPAAVDGRVDTLFIRKSKETYGLYDKANRTVIIDEDKEIQNASLINLAAVRSFIQGAVVYLLNQEDMPQEGVAMNAIMRY